MNKIKNFESFINEELKPETYISASKKLKGMRHHNRADKLETHAKEQIKHVKPVTFEMYGEEYTIDHRNVFNIVEDSHNGNLYFEINFDLNIKPYDDTMTDEEMENGEPAPVIDFSFYKSKNSNDYKFMVDGFILPDRKNALKMLKFIKEYFSYYGGSIEKEVNKLTVNQLYEE